MNCPVCWNEDTFVLDTRPVPGGMVTRRRSCDCGARWTTQEMVIVGTVTSETVPQPVVFNGQEKTTAYSGHWLQPVVVNGHLTTPVRPQPVDFRPQPVVGKGVGGSLPSDLILSGQNPDRSKQNLLDLRLDSRSRTLARRVTKYTPDFLRFWRVYPNKKKKLAAFLAWEKAQPDLADVMAALAWQTVSDEWTKDGGAYVPHAATYVNGARWEDERPAPVRKPPSRPEVF